MPLDPCTDGCINHNIGAATGPAAGDDPCNSAGNGYFCEGSYWSFDPDAAGADTATYGDCARLWLRTGGDCNVDQWLEIAIAEMRVEVAAPVDGVDCCPPGTMWCVPAAGAVTEDQLWISSDGCGTCTWSKLSGFPRMLSNFTGPTITINEGVDTFITPANIVVDNFGGMVAAPAAYTIPETGCYQISGWVIGNYTDINFRSAIFRYGITINGGPGPWIGQSTQMTLNRLAPLQVNVIADGSTFQCFAAGTVIRPFVSWNTAEGTTQLDITLADFRLIRVKD